MTKKDMSLNKWEKTLGQTKTSDTCYNLKLTSRWAEEKGCIKKFKIQQCKCYSQLILLKHRGWAILRYLLCLRRDNNVPIATSNSCLQAFLKSSKKQANVVDEKPTFTLKLLVTRVTTGETEKKYRLSHSFTWVPKLDDLWEEILIRNGIILSKFLLRYTL